jgi:hypothetical protein
MSEDRSEYLANACNVGNVSYYPAVAMLDGWVLDTFIGEQLAEFEVKCLHCIPSGRPAPLGWATCTTSVLVPGRLEKYLQDSTTCGRPDGSPDVGWSSHPTRYAHNTWAKELPTMGGEFPCTNATCLTVKGCMQALNVPLLSTPYAMIAGTSGSATLQGASDTTLSIRAVLHLDGIGATAGMYGCYFHS